MTLWKMTYATLIKSILVIYRRFNLNQQVLYLRANDWISITAQQRYAAIKRSQLST